MEDKKNTTMDIEGITQTSLREKFIGLDPVFRCCMKLFVRDIENLQTAVIKDNPNNQDCRWRNSLFCYKNHVVSKVELMGIVVKMNKRERCHTYTVDDGTGVINCQCWKNARQAASASVSYFRNLPASLHQKYETLQKYNQNREMEGYALGDLLLIRGRVCVYRDLKEIDVLDHQTGKVNNPDKELEAVMRLSSLYQVYETPFVLPRTMALQLEKMEDANNKFNEMAVLVAISQHIQDPGFSQSVITPQNLLSWQAITALAEKSQNCPLNQEKKLDVIKSALTSLEKTKGSVCKRSWQHDTYEIVSAQCPLSLKLMSLLKEVCQNDRNAEAGCSVEHIQGLLSKRYCEYSSVQSKVITYVFSCLESNSDVICIGDKRYLPMV